MNNLIQEIELEEMKNVLVPFRVGDLIAVRLWAIEGSKKRIQIFEGIVIAIRNRGLNSSFTMRKISGDDSVERVFQKYSPIIINITVVRRGFVRQAKLYYLRGLSGKKARIKERLF